MTGAKGKEDFGTREKRGNGSLNSFRVIGSVLPLALMMWTRQIARPAAIRAAFTTQRTSVRPFRSLLHSLARPLPRPALRIPQRSYSQSPEVDSDPTRPDIFYHVVNGERFAVSFLDTFGGPDEVIGWLPARADGAGLNDFVPNRASRALCVLISAHRPQARFTTLLHASIRAALEADLDDIQRNGATQLQNGWMHIHDERNLPPMGRIGDPDDIIACVLVEDGKVRAQHHRRCCAHGLADKTRDIPGHASLSHLYRGRRHPAHGRSCCEAEADAAGDEVIAHGLPIARLVAGQESRYMQCAAERLQK